MTERNKPLVYMTPSERRDAFDEIGKKLNCEILKEAREGKNEVFSLAIITLTMTDGRERVVNVIPEYGDREGIGQADSFIAEAGRTDLLLPGEELRREVVLTTLAKVRS